MGRERGEWGGVRSSGEGEGEWGVYGREKGRSEEEREGLAILYLPGS